MLINVMVVKARISVWITVQMEFWRCEVGKPLWFIHWSVLMVVQHVRICVQQKR
jgi:hypothetical protein